MIGLGLDVWRGVKGIGAGGGGGPVLPAALSDVTHVILFGASIEVQVIDVLADPSLSVGAPLFNDYMREKHGLNIIFTRRAYTGATIQTLKDNWDTTVRAEVVSLVGTGAKPLIIMHPLGNTITELAPYATASGATLAARQATLNALVTDVKSVVGSRYVHVINGTSRNYDPSGSCITDPELGSLPFYRNWIWPLMGEWEYQSRPYGDLFPINFNHYTRMADQIHSQPMQNQMFGMYYGDLAAAMIKGAPPPRVAMRADPIADTSTMKKSMLLDYRATTTMTRSTVVLGAINRGYQSTGIAEQAWMGGWDSYEPVLGLSARTDTWSATSQTGVGTGDTSRTILNDAFRLNYHNSASASWLMIDEITGLAPFQNVEITILSCRNAPTGTRFMELSIDATNVIGEIDGACVPGAIPRTIKLTVQADANGKRAVYGRCKSGNTTGMYVNAMFVDPK